MFIIKSLFITQSLLFVCFLQLFVCEEILKKIHHLSPTNSNKIQNSKSIQDNVQTANSNAYEYIEEVRPIHYSANGYGYGDTENSGHTYDSYGSSEDPYTTHSYAPKAVEHRYYTIRKSKSFFSDDVGFVIIIVGLTIFFGALSSILIPLALSLFSTGGLLGLGGPYGGPLLGGGIGGPLPVPGIIGGVLGRRRRRSLDVTNSKEKLFEYGKQLNEAFRQFQSDKNEIHEE